MIFTFYHPKPMRDFTLTAHRHLLQNFSRNILERGKRLFQNDAVIELEFEKETKAFYSLVESESFHGHYYEVEIEFDEEFSAFWHSCTCPYGGNCKHVAATFMQIIRDLSSGRLVMSIDPKNHTVKTDLFDEKHIRALTGEIEFKKARKLAKNKNSKLKVLKAGEAEYTCSSDNNTYRVKLKNKRFSNEIETSCQCKDTENNLCIHKTAAFLTLADIRGMYGLFDTHDYTLEKKGILSQVGLDIKDNYDEIIHFRFRDNDIAGEIINEKFIDPNSSNLIRDYVRFDALETLFEETPGEYMTGYLLNFISTPSSAESEFMAVTGKKSKKGDRMIGKPDVTIFPLSDSFWKSVADEKDYKIVELMNRTTMARDGLFTKVAPELERFRSIFGLCQDKQVYARKGDWDYRTAIKATELVPVYLSLQPVKAKARCSLQKPYITVRFSYLIDDKEILLHNTFDKSYLFVEQRNNIHLWQSAWDYSTLTILKGKDEILIPVKQWKVIWDSWLRDLANNIIFEFDEYFNPVTEMTHVKTQPRVYLKEEGNFLLVYPAMAYHNIDVHVLEKGEHHYTKDDKKILRDQEKEQALIRQIASTHPTFNISTFQPFFYIPADKVLEKMWFINFYETCKRENIEVFGIENLKKVKYYPAKPLINYRFKSGTDWFDIHVQISYDNFTVSLTDIRKAVLKKSKYIMLGNNKFAMLPEEWINRFSAAIRFGSQGKDETIRLKKSQFALIHDLYDEINDVEVQRELAEKKALLNGNDGIIKIREPKTITARLRDYQSEGISWLAYLYKINLGGCLADDMGLGKTLQMLAIFAWAKGQHPNKRLTNLVVCPTSLLYNWKNEIDKFSPALKTVIHWGLTRDTDSSSWKKQDIIITSYGTLTNDIEWIRKFKFNVAVLDESQAIKNPASLRYKAVNLISARQRYVMTGTPIENNTVELYAQMHFLNPGILGPLNAFRNDFASSIEKDRDEDKINHLKQLVHPFILRRKKEDVAKELPPKTEQVLFCAMDEEQRRVYDAHKEDIRDRIMNKIDTEGINKSRFTVLEGLTKLRQICDSPALLNSDEDYGYASIKADELVRHITGKISDHKALVFSQFLGMLSLIEERLQKEKIKYVKLTGSSTKRQELVNAFENDKDCRVFLISLRAGGLGLNLISADYVFLVDPWWNPAVENQAIDRTHRIGQTRNVFAYRMICKNTIEEKIMDIQKKKKALADDLINTEQGFVSKLTKKDLEQLFS